MKSLNFLILGLGLFAYAPVAVTAQLQEPVSLARAQPQQSARQLFSRYATLMKNNDPKIIDLYAENAAIHLSRENSSDRETLTKGEYREMLTFFLSAFKKKGDRLEPFEVSYQPSGNRVQISTTWYSRATNIGFTQILVVGPNSKGRWMIFEEYQ
jgi:hypothetical protein